MEIRTNKSIDEIIECTKYTKYLAPPLFVTASLLSFYRGYEVSKNQNLLEAKVMIEPKTKYDNNSPLGYYLGGSIFLVLAFAFYFGSSMVRKRINKLKRL